MKTSRARTVCIAVAGIATVVFGSMAAYAAITVFRQDAYSPYIGLRGGEAQLTARVLRTPVGETTGAWHYHPGNVYNVVTQGTITIEDGCGAINQYSKGQAFETSEGRVHRAYNLGAEDAIEYNMFVGPPNRPIGVNIPNNEHLCGPPSTVEECRNDGWTTFNFPAPFADQGACVSYVQHRPRISVLVPEDPAPITREAAGGRGVAPDWSVSRCRRPGSMWWHGVYSPMPDCFSNAANLGSARSGSQTSATLSVQTAPSATACDSQANASSKSPRPM